MQSVAYIDYHAWPGSSFTAMDAHYASLKGGNEDVAETLLDRNLVLTLEVLESLLVSSGKYLVVVLAKIY